MRIIEPGVVPTYRQQCDHCKTVFDYQKADTKGQAGGGLFDFRVWHNVVCPACRSVSLATFVGAPK